MSLLGDIKARKKARDAFGSMPDGLWVQCRKCAQILFKKDLTKAFQVCPKCDYHFPLTADQRIEITVDRGTFAEINHDLVSLNPLSFPEYDEKLKRDTAKCNRSDGMVTGIGQIEAEKVVLGVVDFRFIGGTMGSVYGEKAVRAIELAIDHRLPVVFFLASGGARMQEGLLALMQMPKTCAAVAQLGLAKLPYITVLTDPTMAGVYASFASMGDFIIAEPNALIGFAGERVGEQAQANAKELPKNFKRSEYQKEHGMIDLIVPRKDMRATLKELLYFGRGEILESN